MRQRTTTDIQRKLKRKRQDSGKREAGRFAELTQREFEIVHITQCVTPE
jgi:hypothetical protein